MFGLRKAFILTTLFLATFTSASVHTPEDDTIVDWDKFQSILDKIDPSVLHSVLHQLSPKFKDGVFSKDRSAMEHVHSENPAVASKLVHIAMRRQAGNATASSRASESSSIASSISSALQNDITATTRPDETTITVAPTAPAGAVPITTQAGGEVVYSYIGGGLVTRTSSGVLVSFTPSTSTRLVVSTAPDGSLSTSTTVVVVNAPITGATGPTGAGAASETGDPGLSDGAAILKISGLLMALAGIGGAFVLGL